MPSLARKGTPLGTSPLRGTRICWRSMAVLRVPTSVAIPPPTGGLRGGLDCDLTAAIGNLLRKVSRGYPSAVSFSSYA